MATIKTKIPLLLALCFLVTGPGCTKELRKSRHLSRADKAFKANKYSEAEIEYLKVLQLVPLQADAVRQLGIIYQEEGKLLHANKFLDQAAKLEPDNTQVRLKLGLNAVSTGDAKKAAENARLVLAKQPGQPEALELLASTATTTNNFLDVQHELETLQKADKDRAGYHVAFATLDFRRHDLTNAETEFKKAVQLDPKSSGAWLGLGTIYVAKNDRTAAEQAFKSAADSAPIRSVAKLKYAQFELGIGKSDQAKKMVEEITTAAPDYLPAWDFLAQLAYSQKNYEECNSLLQRVLARDMYNVEALILNGNLKMAQGDAEKAIAIFTQVGTFYGSPQVQYLLARAYLMHNEASKAMVALSKAVQFNPQFSDAVLLLANLKMKQRDPSGAISLLNALLKGQPKNASAYMLLAEAYLAKKDSTQAVEVCRRLVEEFPKNAEARLILGTLLSNTGNIPEARKAFESALAIAPDYLNATEKLVDLDLAERKYDDAIKRTQQRIDANPASPEPYLILAKIHINHAQAIVGDEKGKNPDSSRAKLQLRDIPAAQPEVSQAEAVLKKAIDLNPTLRTPYLMLAELYVASGKQQQALDSLNGLLTKTNDLTALVQVGIIQGNMKNYPAARDCYEKALALEPNFAPALNNLAVLYLERFNDADKAFKLAEKAHQLKPEDPATSDTFGWILYKRGDFKEALNVLSESETKMPTDPEIQYHVGMAHYSLGNEEEAAKSLQIAKASGKEFSANELLNRYVDILAIDPKRADASAAGLLEKELKDSPRDIIALKRLAAIQERDGAFAKAADTYQSALTLNPQNVGITLKLAQLYASPQVNDPQKALTLAKSAHDLAPDDPQISALLGQLVCRNKDYKWAASLLEDSARKLPDDLQVAFDQAWAYYGIGRISDSKTIMERVANSPNAGKSDEAKRFLASVNAAEDPAKATAFASEAQSILARDPGYLPALIALAVAQQAGGNYQKAAESYNQALALDPLLSPATRNLGLLSFDHLNDDGKAYELLQKSREAFPRDAEVARALGILNYRKGNFSRAAQLLKESSQTRKQDAELLFYLGMAQYQAKAKHESKAALEQALTFELPAKLANEARRVLAELK